MNSRTRSNLRKEKHLLDAIDIALRDLKIRYEPLYHKYNFKNEWGKGVPDYDLGCLGTLEAKNWNCERYWVSAEKALEQIIHRFIDYDNPKMYYNQKYLVISRPRWINHTREFLIAHGINIIELGYFVDEDNIDKASKDIKDKLGEYIKASSQRSQCEIRIFPTYPVKDTLTYSFNYSSSLDMPDHMRHESCVGLSRHIPLSHRPPFYWTPISSARYIKGYNTGYIIGYITYPTNDPTCPGDHSHLLLSKKSDKG